MHLHHTFNIISITYSWLTRNWYVMVNECAQRIAITVFSFRRECDKVKSVKVEKIDTLISLIRAVHDCTDQLSLFYTCNVKLWKWNRNVPARWHFLLQHWDLTIIINVRSGFGEATLKLLIISSQNSFHFQKHLIKI